MNYFLTIILLLLPMFISVSCSFERKSNETMAFSKVKYIEDFPKNYELSGTKQDIGVIGITDFCIKDSLILFSTQMNDSLWVIKSLPHFANLGGYLRVGNGPGEFIFAPFVSEASYYMDGKNMCADIYDFQKGLLYTINVSKTIKTKSAQIEMQKDSVPRQMFPLIKIGKAKYFCRDISSDGTIQNRFILTNGVRSTNTSLDYLNKTTLKRTEDINVLSAYIKSLGNKIVEAPIYMNFINLYTLDGSFAESLCIGSNLVGAGDVVTQKEETRMKTFLDLRLYDSFFATLMKESDTKVNVLLFDWQGNPITRLGINHFADSFDFDLKNKCLYTYNSDTEDFYRYDLPDSFIR